MLFFVTVIFKKITYFCIAEYERLVDAAVTVKFPLVGPAGGGRAPPPPTTV